MDSMNLFLNDSLVLPSGEWDKENLTPLIDMARKTARKKQKNDTVTEYGEQYGQWDWYWFLFSPLTSSAFTLNVIPQ